MFVCASCFILSIQAQSFHTINSGNFYYTPSNLSINVGDTVQWINDGGLHNVNALNSSITGASFDNPESFISSPTDDNILFTKVFTVSGTYEYDCSVGSHAINGMVGTVVVNPATNSSALTTQKEISDLDVFYRSGRKQIQVEFTLNETADNAILQVHDYKGQNVGSQNLYAESGDNIHLIDVKSNISTGIYLVSLQVDNVIRTKRIFIK